MTPPQFLADPGAATAQSVAVGDVSGDGRGNLVFLVHRSAPNPAQNNTEIYAAYQRSDGRLETAVKIGDSGNNLAFQLLVADLNRDGVGDVITATVNGVLILRSNRDGTYTSSTAAVGDPWEMLVTDVDRDGNPDILVDASDTMATVVYGNGRGGIFRTSTLPMPASATRTLGDVTGDGLNDVILAIIVDRPLQEFRIYPALPSGGYAAPIVLSRPIYSSQTSSVVVGDSNSDGRGDLALDEARDGGDLQVYFQDAHGQLRQSVALARQRGAGVLLAADFDRDGSTDLAIAHGGWSYVGYYLQVAGGFAPEAFIDAQQNFGRINYFDARDLNHDGCTDLAIARVSQSIALLYGQGCAIRRIQAPACRLPPQQVDDARAQSAAKASSYADRSRPTLHTNVRQVGLR